MSAQDGIVHLWNLPDNRVFVQLDGKIGEKMIKIAIIYAGSRKKLAVELSGNIHTRLQQIQKLKNGKPINLSFVRKLSQFLVDRGLEKFSLKKLETKVKSIRTKTRLHPIINPKLPMNFSCKEGAQFIAATFFDGGVTNRGDPFYVNKEEILIEKTIQNVREVVGEIKHYKRKVRSKKSKKSAILVSFPRILGIILQAAGASFSRKVLKDPSLPKFIIDGDSEVQKTFLQQAFDDEAHPRKARKKAGNAIQLTQYNIKNKPPIRLMQLKEMLKNFGIHSNTPYLSRIHKTKKGYITYGWTLEITNQINLKAFKEKIDFSIEEKKKVLEEALSSYKSEPRFVKFTASEEFIKACMELKKENKKITIENVAKKLKKERNYVGKRLKKLTKEKRLKIVKEQEWNGKGSLPKEFDIVAERCEDESCES